MKQIDVLIGDDRKQIVINPVIGIKTTILHEKYSKIEPNDLIQSHSRPHLTKKIILIGTSTGGPGALQAVLTKLPEDIQAPIIIAQHMPSGFTKSLANRLNSLSKIMVKEAENKEILQNGTAYIAPGGSHLRIKPYGKNIVVQLDEPNKKCIHCPSVDALFESATSLREYEKIVVVMTGMGSDGSKGLVSLKNSGQVKAIAESKETSIVFGMPKAAIATQLIDDIENVENIAETIMKYV